MEYSRTTQHGPIKSQFLIGAFICFRIKLQTLLFFEVFYVFRMFPFIVKSTDAHRVRVREKTNIGKTCELKTKMPSG
jgi:hypothetical protein